MAEGVKRKKRYLPGTKAEDLTGQEFGDLTVVRFAKKEWGKTSWRYFWECKCKCGGEKKEADGKSLRSGGLKSCGCAKSKWDRKATRVRNGDDIERDAWNNIKSRTNGSSGDRGGRWAARGIDVCKRWEESFEAFLADMGHRPPNKKSIDRYPDNNGGYWCGHPDCPDCGPIGRSKNARWATAKEQGNNQERTVYLEWKGEKRCLTEWAEVIGIDYKCLWSRYDRGWSVEEILGQQSGEPLKKPRPDRSLKIEYDGRSLTLVEWAKETGISHKTLSSRYYWGWETERILTEPTKPGRRAGRNYSQGPKKQ